MSSTSWARTLAAATLLSAAVAPAIADPVVVDFEPGFVTLANGETYTQADFNITAVGAGAVIDASFCDPLAEFCAVGNNTSFLSALNDTEIDLTHSRIFTLGSFSAAFVPSPLIDFSGAQVKLKLDGINVLGAAVATTVDLAEDGNSGNFVFGLYDASSLGWLRSVHFSVCFDDGVQCGASPFLNDAQFALDDLGLTVPEPGAAWLVALSLAGLALTRRRTSR